jgi:hypothetical protein
VRSSSSSSTSRAGSLCHAAQHSTFNNRSS